MNAILQIQARPPETRMGKATMMTRRMQDMRAGKTVAKDADRGGDSASAVEARTAQRIAARFNHSGDGLVALIDRKIDQCCWPYDTPNGVMFCGSPVVKRPYRHDAGYCAACAERLTAGGAA